MLNLLFDYIKKGGNMSQYIKELPKEAVQVEGTLNWVTPDGRLFGIETRIIPNRHTGIKSKHCHYGEYFQYATTINKHNGYVYAPIKFIRGEGKYEVRQCRLHIIIAKTFIPNPNNLPIVGHKNNIKKDNRADNLYWTTIKENTQKAFNDGLVANAKGYEDSQSHPVIMFDTYTNQELGRYGSAKEANRKTNISINTIMRQCKYKKPVRKPFYFRFQSDNSIVPPPVVVQYDYYTDKEIARFWNSEEASRKTGIPKSTVQHQCKLNQKPKTKPKNNTYFLIKQQ